MERLSSLLGVCEPRGSGSLVGDYSPPRLIPARQTHVTRGSDPYDTLVFVTAHKLYDMQVSILRRLDVIRERDIPEAHTKATLACGAYLAHARPDVAYGTIKQILIEAGGEVDAVESLGAFLEDWRERGGYTKQEAEDAQERAKRGAKTRGIK